MSKFEMPNNLELPRRAVSDDYSSSDKSFPERGFADDYSKPKNSEKQKYSAQYKIERNTQPKNNNYEEPLKKITLGESESYPPYQSKREPPYLSSAEIETLAKDEEGRLNQLNSNYNKCLGIIDNYNSESCTKQEALERIRSLLRDTKENVVLTPSHQVPNKYFNYEQRYIALRLNEELNSIKEKLNAKFGEVSKEKTERESAVQEKYPEFVLGYKLHHDHEETLNKDKQMFSNDIIREFDYYTKAIIEESMRSWRSLEDFYIGKLKKKVEKIIADRRDYVTRFFGKIETKENEQYQIRYNMMVDELEELYEKKMEELNSTLDKLSIKKAT